MISLLTVYTMYKLQCTRCTNYNVHNVQITVYTINKLQCTRCTNSIFDIPYIYSIIRRCNHPLTAFLLSLPTYFIPLLLISPPFPALHFTRRFPIGVRVREKSVKTRLSANIGEQVVVSFTMPYSPKIDTKKISLVTF